MKRKYTKREASEKECTICSAVFLSKSNSAKYCKDCVGYAEYRNKMMDYRWRLKKLLAAAKYRANKKGVEFDLTLDFLEALWEKQKGLCALTGFVFDLSSWGEKSQVNPKAPSIDRIVAGQGYTKENVRLVTYHINCALTEFGESEFENMALSYLQNKRGVQY